MAVADQPGRDALPVRAIAIRDHPFVAVAVDHDASGGTAGCQIIIQGEGGGLPAPVRLASGIVAELPAFRGIDSVEADPLAADLDRVAVDDRSSADDLNLASHGG